MEIIGLISAILLGFLGLLSLTFTLNSLRVPLRHLFRNIRERRTGEIQWYQVVPESRGKSNASKTVAQQLAAIKAFSSRLDADRPYNTRGVSSVIWNKEEDGLLRLYIGMTQNNLDRGASTIKSLAESLNCRAEEMNHPPNVPSKGMVFAQRQINTPSDVRSEPESLGSVAQALSDARHNQGAVIVTMEHVRHSETKRYESYVSEYSIMRAGTSSQYSSNVAGQARIVASSGVRTTISAVSADGNMSRSSDILNTALGGIPSLGMKYSVREPGHQSQRWASVSLLVMAFPFVGSFFLGVPWWIPLAIAGPAVLVNGFNLFVPQIACRSFYEARLKKGEVVVPSFTWYSLRWFIHGIYNSRRYNLPDDGTRGSHRIAAPSCAQVIMMYSTSLAEYMTIPASLDAVNIYTDPIPRIGFPANFERRLPDSIFLGYSGTGQECYYLLDDIQYSSFTAGVSGSGKTNFLQIKYAGLSYLSVKNEAGLQITPIWAETKGEDSYKAWSLVKSIPGAVFIDAHNPMSGTRLALEGRRMSEGASVREVIINIGSLVGGLQFANGDGIKAASRESLDFSMRIAMLLQEDEIRFLGLDSYVEPSKPNIIELAYFILGGDESVQPGPSLKRLRDEIDKHGEEASERQYYLAQAIGTLSPYLDPKNRGAAERKMAPLNKLSEMRNARTFWTPSRDRTDVYIGQLPVQFAPIVLNMGPYWEEEKKGFSRDISEIVSSKSMLMASYLLWSYVKAHCSGWGDMGKRCIVFADEVADIAQDSDSDETKNILDDVSKEGRSRGFAYHCASQNLGQLPEQTVNEVLSFRTVYWFRLPNDKDGRRMLQNTQGGDSKYTLQNTQTTPDGTAVVGRMKHLDKEISAHTMFVPLMKTWRSYVKKYGATPEAVQAYGEEQHFLNYEEQREKARL